MLTMNYVCFICLDIMKQSDGCPQFTRNLYFGLSHPLLQESISVKGSSPETSV